MHPCAKGALGAWGEGEGQVHEHEARSRRARKGTRGWACPCSKFSKMATSSRTRCDWCERPHRATSHESFAPRERIRRFHLLCDQLTKSKERTALEYSSWTLPRGGFTCHRRGCAHPRSFANVPHDELYDASSQPLERITPYRMRLYRAS